MFEEKVHDIYTNFFEIFGERLTSQNNDEQLAPFVVAKGKNYSAQKIRLMIVGRAVNGWTSFNADNAQEFGTKAVHEYHKDIFESWLYLRNNILWSRHSAGYSLNRSAFWRTSRAIWSRLSDQAPEGRWVDNIVWSNLYKVSPKGSGNPSSRLCAQQAYLCRELLAEEIATFAPTHILLVTGWEGWFFHAKDKYDFSQVFADVQKSDEHDGIVEGVAFFPHPSGKKIPSVVTCRPEVKNETLFTEKVINTFQELSAKVR